jgi:cell division protease FtsH
MGQYPPQPLNYMGQPPAPPPRDHRFGRGLFGWVLFIGLAIMLFMLLSKQGGTYKTLPLSEFMVRLEANQIGSVRIEGDEITGTLATGPPFSQYRTQLPDGLSGNWNFMQWVLEKCRDSGVVVEVRRKDSVVANILVPLIPWVLIFGFIWFFVFRQLRRAGAATQPMVITGPGRWVPDEPRPDEPGKAGQP